MNTTTIIVIVLVLAVVAVLAVRGSGPRVTQIDRTIRKDKDDRNA